MTTESTKAASNIRTTIFMLFLFVGLLPALAASVLAFLNSRNALEHVISSSQKDLATELMDKIDREIEYAYVLLRNWVSVRQLSTAVEQGRSRSFDSLQSEWSENGLTKNAAADLLRNFQSSSNNRFKEIFITDRRGYVVAATNKTSDFDQGPQDDPPNGEFWWASAMRNRRFFGRVDYDESAGVYSLDIALSIDLDGIPIGVLKASYNMEHILSLVNVASRGDSVHYELRNEDGVLIAAKNKPRNQLLKDTYSVTFDEDLQWEDLLRNKRGQARGTTRDGRDVSVGYAMSNSQGSRPTTWMTLSHIPIEEAYEQLDQQFRSFAIILPIAIVIIMVLSYVVSNKAIVILGKKERMELELEGARKLQLSMLPREAPNLPNLDIAWHMETATEVGGDYYDYTLNQDGTLTLCLGDATGHGSEAGTVVSATKSLFKTLSDQTDITKIFSAMSRTLKDMNLRGVGMALNILKINGHTMNMSSAGIPPVLHYVSETDEVREILIEGLPLGLSLFAQYEERTINLKPGDAILIMSDGVAERLNSEDEEYGYPRVGEQFLKVATETPEVIIERILQDNTNWAAGIPQDDDTTLVALKFKV
ncbi:MAG: SpoIIE family protein phosphatase [Candidatus Latescibacterota bacterium]|nr:SpoIIE family protein phosphatase [Candidatus Latescibacterota bacterium]